MSSDEILEMKQLMESLKEQLDDRKAALPAHSVRPGQMVEIEELEEQISDLKKKINELERAG